MVEFLYNFVLRRDFLYMGDRQLTLANKRRVRQFNVDDCISQRPFKPVLNLYDLNKVFTPQLMHLFINLQQLLLSPLKPASDQIINLETDQGRQSILNVQHILDFVGQTIELLDGPNQIVLYDERDEFVDQIHEVCPFGCLLWQFA